MNQQPIATYRIQLNPDFSFYDAVEILDYLKKLGVSHVYCSPCLQASPGSTHGYDVVNHSQVNVELGGEDGHAYFCNAVKERNLSILQDIVPNHMAINAQENPWWWDVLENGPSSRYASYFDIEWDPPESRHSNMVIVPVLGDHFGRVLENGEIRLKHIYGRFTIHYYDNVFPVSPRSLFRILRIAYKKCQVDQLAFIADAFSWLPLPTATDRISVQRRHRNKEVLRNLLTRLCSEKTKVNDAINEVVSEINNESDLLNELLDKQNYRLAFWKMAKRDLGYRRFFDINSLVGLRVEDLQVFEDTHTLIIDWLKQDKIQGLRIDHPDGLRYPEQYFDRLREIQPEAWILVEKILEPDESLRESWPIDGTTGYDFLSNVNGIFVNLDNEQKLTDFYTEFTNEPTNYKAIVHAKKHQVLREILGSDVNRLTALLLKICEKHRRYRDYTEYDLSEALSEIIACFPVYRTYIREGEEITDIDKAYIQEAMENAIDNRPDIDSALFDFIQQLILLNVDGEIEKEFAMRFQQFTGPVMAKGVEDTTFYCYNRLVSLNEVGSEPGSFGVSVYDFHKECIKTLKNWHNTMNTTSTHDTKRSEDVRARISLLSEIPEKWENAVLSWSEMNKVYKIGDFPDKNTEYLLYQTLVGAWEISQKRIIAYMEKAVREAKVYTSWTNPNEEFEEILIDFIQNIYSDTEFMNSLKQFVQPLIEPGRINSLSQTLIKLTAPGIPDIYQGTELWNLSLVDPDNRRPVDYERRKDLLHQIEHLSVEQIWNRIDEGLPKLWMIKKILSLRAQNPEAFGKDAEYKPIFPNGSRSEHIVGFMRDKKLITIAPRLIIGLQDDWDNTTLKVPSGKWKNIFTDEIRDGGIVELDDLLNRFPVCLLVREEDN